MKKFIYMLVFIVSSLFANETRFILDVKANADNSVTITGGQKIPGAMIRFESLKTAEILFKQRFSQSSQMNVAIPNEPYQVVLVTGPDEKLVKNGVLLSDKSDIQTVEIKADIMDKISKTQTRESEWNNLNITLYSLAFLLIFLTMYFSSRSSKKILEMVKQNSGE